ncbi:metallophosphoesterase family protein [Caulobacter sp. NIBR2454]|uniref:metallophosphoesterase family protein n=1 Tax=Caulobacter sp. NIBR2454 TaxID=3015996 RepID=UPI0022B73F32|nr:metallophosphoesterase family protein [Caulobacter sp. NIBR2454]
MFKRLFSFANAKPAKAPDGVRIYAIGDVHGCADLLNALLERIYDEALKRPSHASALVMLGDYVDRGPRSDAVLQTLVTLKERSPVPVRFLAGNHDDTLLEFLADPAVGETWCEFGGRETLMSYRVTPPARGADIEAWRAAQIELRAVMPQSHVNFLQGLEESVTLGDYTFVHAGARPGVALDEQSRRDRLWIRGEFLNDTRPFERMVVHGHTPADEPHSDKRRIGVDTGAYATGVLTAVVLDGEERGFLQTRRVAAKGPILVEALAA